MHHHFIDRFALGNSPIHRLDARAKLVAVVGYTIVLISFHRYTVAGLAPMAVLPLAMLWFGGVPVGFALRRAAIFSPVILMFALMCPIYDRAAQPATFGPWQFELRGGWFAAGDVALKFTFGVLALTALVCTTRFALLLEAMRRLGVPRAIVAQLGFLYHYIFVLIDEAMRIRRARDFRGAAQATISRRLAAGGGVIGSLFIRTLDRSERIQIAMSARGYRGETHGLGRLRFTGRDAAFLILVAAYLAVCRFGYPRWTA
jgi:cobalt/nickel transport system permease protein